MSRIVLVTGGGTGLGKAVAVRFRADGDTVIITGIARHLKSHRQRDRRDGDHLRREQDPRQVTRIAPLGSARTWTCSSTWRAATPTSPGPAGSPRTWKRWPRPGGRTWTPTCSARYSPRPPSSAGCARAADLNVSSIGAEYASTSYGAAKAALAAWTAGLSAEVGQRGLTANVISPGYIAETGFFRGRLTEQRRAALIGATHDGRAGQPGDIAETAYFLASAGARHITGQTLHVNGGAHTTR